VKHDLKTPCHECPYVGNIPGWIGRHASAQEFVDIARADVRFPCHQTIDYSDKQWEVKVQRGEAQQCVGQLAFMNRLCKRSIDPGVAAHQDRVRADKSIEVVWPPELLVRVHSSSITEGIKLRDDARKAKP
jgi:hypothetical protein